MLKEKKEDDLRVCVRDRVVVNLHTSMNQVLMIVNAPTGFKLSLDFLPCFQPQVDDPHKGGWIAAGSSGGLWLCTTGRFHQSQYYICNPFTKQWVAIPPAPRLHYRVHVGFIVELCRSKCLLQLQQPLCSNCKFQVVRFHHEHQCQQMHPRTHMRWRPSNQRTGQWTIETVSSLQEMRWYANIDDSQSILHNRRLHWRAGDKIVVYDPYKKVLLGVNHQPSRLQLCRRSRVEGLSVSDGSLWISQFADVFLDLRFWQLKGYDMHTCNLDDCYWRPMYKFNIMDLTGGPKWGPKVRGCTILGMHPYDPNIALCRRGSRPRSSVSRPEGSYLVDCNLRTKTLSKGRFWNFSTKEQDI